MEANRDRAAELGQLAARGVLPPGDDRRRELVEYLLDAGATVDEVVAAADEGQLTSLLGDRLLAHRGTVTVPEAAHRLAIDADLLRATLQAAGLPVPEGDDPGLAEGDVDAVARLLPTLDVFPQETALQMLRVMSSSLERIADAVVAAYLDAVERDLYAERRPPVEHARVVQESILVLGAAASTLEHLLSRHVRMAILRNRRAREGQMEALYDTIPLAVGFVDLVGYTSLSGQLSPGELSALIARFEEAAFAAMAGHDGRIVKHIGDAVMYVTLDAASAVEVALDLIDRFEGSGVAPRAGIATGLLLTRAGDYYGREVNLAARMADLAVGGEVLVTAEAREALRATGSASEAARFAIEGAGRRNIKGFDEPVALWSVTRA